MGISCSHLLPSPALGPAVPYRILFPKASRLILKEDPAPLRLPRAGCGGSAGAQAVPPNGGSWPRGRGLRPWLFPFPLSGRASRHRPQPDLATA